MENFMDIWWQAEALKWYTELETKSTLIPPKWVYAKPETTKTPNCF